MIFAQIEATQPNPIAALFPLFIIFFIFYFLLIRPQQKKQKQHQGMIAGLKRNDQVVTIGGVHGVIQDIKKDSILLKVDENTKLLVEKTAVAKIKDTQAV